MTQLYSAKWNGTYQSNWSSADSCSTVRSMFFQEKSTTVSICYWTPWGDGQHNVWLISTSHISGPISISFDDARFIAECGVLGISLSSFDDAQVIADCAVLVTSLCKASKTANIKKFISCEVCKDQAQLEKGYALILFVPWLFDKITHIVKEQVLWLTEWQAQLIIDFAWRPDLV